MIGFKPGIMGLIVCSAIGCGTQVKTDHDPTANFPQYRTFTVAKTKIVTDGDVDRGETLVTDRINSAIESKLLNKGLQPARPHEKPDLLVAFTAGNRSPHKIDAVWKTGGREYSASAGGNEVWEDTSSAEGTLVIDFIDADSKKLVWRSVAKVDNEQLVEPEIIERAVDKALKKFPSA